MQFKASGGTDVMRNYNDNNFDPSINYNPDTDTIRKLVELIKSKDLTVTFSMFAHLENVISGNPELPAPIRLRHHS